MGGSAASSRALSTTFLDNYKTVPVVVSSPRVVALPNLSSFPPVPPAPWSIVFPFDQPSPFDGVQDLLWELIVLQHQHSSDYVLDATIAGNVPGPGSVFMNSGGCGTANGTFRLTGFGPQTSNVGNTTLGYCASGGPAAASALLALGLRDPALSLSFCELVCTSAEVALPCTTRCSRSDWHRRQPTHIALPVSRRDREPRPAARDRFHTAERWCRADELRALDRHDLHTALGGDAPLQRHLLREHDRNGVQGRQPNRALESVKSGQAERRLHSGEAMRSAHQTVLLHAGMDAERFALAPSFREQADDLYEPRHPPPGLAHKTLVEPGERHLRVVAER